MLPLLPNEGLMMPNRRESFNSELAEVSWRDLRVHLQRDAIITVDAALDLVAVAVAVSGDDKQQVQQWLEQGLLGKPSVEVLEVWEREQETSFWMLIVQPFILIQDAIHG
jgi:hypothetical protein